MESRLYKHKVLLDEGFPPRSYFPRLNQRFDVKHVKSDFKKVGLPDEAVYALAAEQKRLIITYNTKDFKRLAGKSKDTALLACPHSCPMRISTINSRHYSPKVAKMLCMEHTLR